jgi:hypothetical protein
MPTLLFAPLVLALPFPGGNEEAIARALDRALERSQARLRERVELVDDHSTWEQAWEIGSENFNVKTPMNWYIGARLGRDLDAMLEHFRKLTRSNWRPQVPLPIYLFPNLGDYNTFGNDFGEHHSSVLGSFYATSHPERPVTMYFHVNPYYLGMWATHSAFHQFVAQAFTTTPPTWFEEGLAAYFSIYYWDTAYGVGEFERIVRDGSFLPLSQLMREGVDAYPADPQTRFVELAMLFNYLLNYREDTRTQTNENGDILLAPAADFVADVLAGRDVSWNPVQELVSVRLAELEADLKAYDFTP